MTLDVDRLTEHVLAHRCASHPVFHHWAEVGPGPEAVGAAFHQIQRFCAATRPGGRFPAALRHHGLVEQARLMQEIVDSEADHGADLATMAGYLLNRAAGRVLCPDLHDREAVEATLKYFSDQLLAGLPGYDERSGLTLQCRRARALFARRELTDRDATLRNLGVALALEIISHRHLIPGEKRCLIDAGLYGVGLSDPEMHYLLEHWGEAGAEHHHEENATAAVAAALELSGSAPLLLEGAHEFLETLAALWDVIDASLLQSGVCETRGSLEVERSWS